MLTDGDFLRIGVMKISLIAGLLLVLAMTAAVGSAHDAERYFRHEARAQARADRADRKAERGWRKAERRALQADRKAARSVERSWRRYDRWR